MELTHNKHARDDYEIESVRSNDLTQKKARIFETRDFKICDSHLRDSSQPMKRKNETSINHNDVSDLLDLKKIKFNDQSQKMCIIEEDDLDIDFSTINNVLKEFEMLRRLRKGVKGVSCIDMSKAPIRSRPSSGSILFHSNTTAEGSACNPPP
jgi:hypothetical protein